MLVNDSAEIVEIVAAAPVDSEIFMTLTALELVRDSLAMTELYGFQYVSGIAGRYISILDTPGAPAVLVLDSEEFRWGCTDVNTGRRFLVGQFGLYLDTDSDDVELSLLGGESFISF
jgi:hypothetical protein